MERQNRTAGSDDEICEWTVTGMDCAACTQKLSTAVSRLPGVTDVSVNLMAERLRLRLEPGASSRSDVEAAVRTLGYGVGPRAAGRATAITPETRGDSCSGEHDHDGHDHGHAATAAAAAGDHGMHDHGADAADKGLAWYRTPKGRLVLGTGLLLAVATAAKVLVPGPAVMWIYVAACLIGVAPVAWRALAAVRAGIPFTIEMLMTIAVTGALFIGAWEEAALVVFLFAVGEVLEGVAANRARASIRALTDLVPRTALVETPAGLSEVAAETLGIGQTVLVRPGDRIPADGDVVEGMSGVDESPVTGESVPRAKGVGDPVFAGSINVEAALKVRVSRAADDNTIARIIRLVEEAESARAPTERFIDRFSRYYMPAVVAIALLVTVAPPLLAGADWQVWIYRGLALLLIGCPCALVISVPASIAAALSSGARRGLLMKGGAVIEVAAKVRQVAFDKTGTLTEGHPVVTDTIPLGHPEAELLSVASAVENASSHPLARAIVEHAKATRAPVLDGSAHRALAGKGAEAMVGDGLAWVGSPGFAASVGALPPEAAGHADRLERQGKTVVAVFRKGRALGLIALRDEPRADARGAIAALAGMGVTGLMLTGDNERTAAAIAGDLGLDHRAGLMPEDKVTAIRALAESGGVMMVGDGINDAPALAQSSVGVAMGSGTDVALETADAALLGNRVTDVPAMIRLARTTMGNIHQNVALALGLKAVFLVTSVLGITGLWIAIMADTGATVLVTANALRLLRYDPTRA